MREQKSVVNYRSIYDHSGISIYLEKMARKGWLLEKIGNYFWKFRKIVPQEHRETFEIINLQIVSNKNGRHHTMSAIFVT
jgi:hypothetical protein